MVVIFALMPNGDDSHRSHIVDGKPGNMAGATERNHQLAHQGRLAAFATTERGVFQKAEDALDRFDSAFRRGIVTLSQKPEKAQQIIPRLIREANPECHAVTVV